MFIYIYVYIYIIDVDHIPNLFFVGKTVMPQNIMHLERKSTLRDPYHMRDPYLERPLP